MGRRSPSPLNRAFERAAEAWATCQRGPDHRRQRRRASTAWRNGVPSTVVHGLTSHAAGPQTNWLSAAVNHAHVRDDRPCVGVAHAVVGTMYMRPKSREGVVQPRIDSPCTQRRGSKRRGAPGIPRRPRCQSPSRVRLDRALNMIVLCVVFSLLPRTWHVLRRLPFLAPVFVSHSSSPSWSRSFCSPRSLPLLLSSLFPFPSFLFLRVLSSPSHFSSLSFFCCSRLSAMWLVRAPQPVIRREHRYQPTRARVTFTLEPHGA